MKKKIICADSYEAQKLSSLIYVKNSRDSFITGILDVIDNEVIISVKDKSAHSILLKDNFQVDTFTDFIQSVIEQTHKIKEAKVVQDTIEIDKE